METRWSPDTCGCVLGIINNEYWDSPSPLNCEVVKRCEAHKHISLEDIPAEIRWENKSKNDAYRVAVDAVVPDTLVNFKWSFDKERKLQVSFETVFLTPQQKALVELSLREPLDGASLDDTMKERIKSAFGISFEQKPETRVKVQRELDKQIGKTEVVSD